VLSSPWIAVITKSSAMFVTIGGITGEMVRDLMVESVESGVRPVVMLPDAIEWLSDNDSCYTATKTMSFAKNTA
jgi:hypothetical protein